MWQRASPAVRWGLLVGLAALALAILDVWWFHTYRSGYPFDIDEAGYLTFGLIDYLGLKTGGLDGWWETIQNQSTFAPLLPALTSLTVFVRPGVLNGYLVLTGFMVVLAMASYGIGERLAGPRLGALAALVTATLPGTFAYAREYIFAMPVAAFLACAVFALLRSDGMRRRRWAIACGAAIGLMLLSRTMAITYVPGLLVAAAVAIWAGRNRDLGVRIVNLALLVVTAVAVAATWYAKNLQSVIDYLTSYGYGKQSQFYGEEHALVSWGRFRSVAESMISEDLFLPMSAVLLLGLVGLAVAAFRRLRPREGRVGALAQIAGSDTISVALVFAIGYGGLMSSQNGGDGFSFPLVVLLPPLAAAALRHFPPVQKPAIAALVLIAAVNVVSTSTIWGEASRLRLASLPSLAEPMPVTKGAPKAVMALREQAPGPETVFTSEDAGWPQVDAEIVDIVAGLEKPNGELPLVAFGPRSWALNVNTVQLAAVVEDHRSLPLTPLEANPDNSVATYRRLLSDPAHGKPSVLITMSSEKDDFIPVVTQARVEGVAKEFGFRRIAKLRVPNGREVYVWRR